MVKLENDVDKVNPGSFTKCLVCLTQGDLNEKETELNLYGIFFILTFNDLLLFS